MESQTVSALPRMVLNQMNVTSLNTTTVRDGAQRHLHHLKTYISMPNLYICTWLLYNIMKELTSPSNTTHELGTFQERKIQSPFANTRGLFGEGMFVE